MIILLAIPIWIFLIVLTLTACVSAQREDLNQDPASASAGSTDRTSFLALPHDREEHQQSQLGHGHRAARAGGRGRQ